MKQHTSGLEVTLVREAWKMRHSHQAEFCAPYPPIWVSLRTVRALMFYGNYKNISEVPNDLDALLALNISNLGLVGAMEVVMFNIDKQKFQLGV